MSEQEIMTIAVTALTLAYLLGGIVKRFVDRAMPLPHIERQIELLKSIDDRLGAVNGALSKTLGITKSNHEGIKELQSSFLPHAQSNSEGIPRWWCHWPQVKGELMSILEEIRNILKREA